MSDKNPLEVVRIKDPSTGLERNATRAHAKTINATVIEDAPVRDQYDRPVPAERAKPRTDLAGKPVAGKPGEKKES